MISLFLLAGDIGFFRITVYYCIDIGFLEYHTPDVFFILEQLLDGYSAPILFSPWGRNALLIQPVRYCTETNAVGSHLKHLAHNEDVRLIGTKRTVLIPFISKADKLRIAGGSGLHSRFAFARRHSRP